MRRNMAAEKKKAVLPRIRNDEVEEPDFLFKPSGKYNTKVMDGDYVDVPLDDKGVPLIVLPKKDKKK